MGERVAGAGRISHQNVEWKESTGELKAASHVCSGTRINMTLHVRGVSLVLPSFCHCFRHNENNAFIFKSRLPIGSLTVKALDFYHGLGQIFTPCYPKSGCAFIVTNHFSLLAFHEGLLCLFALRARQLSHQRRFKSGEEVL